MFWRKDTHENRVDLFNSLSGDGRPFGEYDFEDLVYENDYVLIDGKIYKAFYDVRGGDISEGLEDVEVSKDGDIYFTTIHYNGGASLEEVIEGALKRKQP